MVAVLSVPTDPFTESKPSEVADEAAVVAVVISETAAAPLEDVSFAINRELLVSPTNAARLVAVVATVVP